MPAMPVKKETVFVGLSGGVDSSVAAYLLKKKGYKVVGVFMRCYNVDGCAETDAEDARRVAEKLEIPFYTWDFEEEYKRKVVEYMIEGYRAGLTPNPDVMCNREIKFGLFLKKALALGADYVATGHYARVRAPKRQETNKKRKAETKSLSHVACPMSLFAGKDSNKDQSYFLWTLTQEELKHCLFPIGDLTKPAVRSLAKKAELLTAEKKDSQGICFLGQVSIADFLSKYISGKEGAIVTPDGQVIGTHHGAQFVTVGQRSHLGQVTSNKGQGDTKPRYVVAKDVGTNTVTVAEGHDNPLLFKKEITLSEVNLISGRERRVMSEERVYARVRYRQPLSPATLLPCDKQHATSNKKRIKQGLSPVSCHLSLVFDKPQQFVAEGQSAVWYSKQGEVLGGGIITDAE